jgi:ABC-type lipoprotein export system ATPase subunit
VIDSALRFVNVSKAFPTTSGGERLALRDVNATLRVGRTVALVGRSGSGKSTFLHLAAGIDLPTEGQVLVRGQDLGSLDESARCAVRRDQVGLVFQFFHLLPHLSLLENVALPELIAGGGMAAARDRAEELLTRVGLGNRGEDSVQKLSGGEMQRVAICRALLRHPPLLLADEPTGNLDDESGRAVMELMLELVREEESTLLYVTHSLEVAALADETWRLTSGTLTLDGDPIASGGPVE